MTRTRYVPADDIEPSVGNALAILSGALTPYDPAVVIHADTDELDYFRERTAG